MSDEPPTCQCDNCGSWFEYKGQSIPLYCDDCQDYIDWKREEEEATHER